jgi:hypothetical protein
VKRRVQLAQYGSPIALDRIKGLDENQLAACWHGALDRDDPARVALPVGRLRAVVYLYRKGGTAQAEFADAYDLHLRPLPVDQCAGSVAAQKKRVA